MPQKGAKKAGWEGDSFHGFLGVVGRWYSLWDLCVVLTIKGTSELLELMKPTGMFWEFTRVSMT
jgi:hypothetical protein